MKTYQKVAIPLGLFAVFSVGTVKMFGNTVSSKFSEANGSVVNQVTFGGSADFAYRAPRPAARRAIVPTDPVQRATPTIERSTSTFSIDVDTGSYTVARRAIEGGYLPASQNVRVEEFVNYFPYAYLAPPSGRSGTVQIEAAPSPFSTRGDTHLLRIGLNARTLSEPVPVHLVFLVDTSGSMRSSDRLDLAKQSILTATANLKPTDRVAIVSYAGSSQVVLDSTPASRRDDVRNALDLLSAGGGTAMGSGMRLAYDIATRHAGAGRVSRVVVMSDGDANIGATSSGSILDAVRSHVEDGVMLTTVGFGTGNYNDELMERLADAGNGNYIYIDSLAEVPLAFGDRLQSMLHVVAKDVKIQVDFDADAVKSWRQIGYENRRLADHEFRDDRVDAGELGAGHQVTALYEVTLKERLNPRAPIATVRLRHKAPDEFEATEATTTFVAGAVRSRIGDSSDDFRFQAAVAALALNLKGESHQSLDWVEEVARTATAGRAERLRFLELVRRAAELRERM